MWYFIIETLQQLVLLLFISCLRYAASSSDPLENHQTPQSNPWQNINNVSSRQYNKNEFESNSKNASQLPNTDSTSQPTRKPIEPSLWEQFIAFAGGVWPAVVEIIKKGSLYIVRIFGQDFLYGHASNPIVRYFLLKLQRSSEREYISAFQKMLQFEMEEEENELKKYQRNNVKLTFHKDRTFHFPITNDMTEMCNAIDENQLNLFNLVSKNQIEMQQQIRGRIMQHKEGKVYVEIYADAFALVDTNEKYTMNFQVIRKNHDLQMTALQFVGEHNLFKCLIKNPAYHRIGEIVSRSKVNYKLSPDCEKSINFIHYKLLACNESNENQYSHHRYFQSKVFTGLNAEQKSAVVNIVSGKNYPLPYLLYGPPGTGKTMTLVAAIEQIVRMTNKNILVCAMSNSACDEITERLIPVLNKYEIYRLYAFSYNLDNISSSIKKVCNISEDKLYSPPLSNLYQSRVVICTLSTAGCLTVNRADGSLFDVHHFEYVFIDECASSPETMTLIPISGLCSSPKKIHANIILSGDPKQLPAVIKSKKAEDLGFKISLMEHLLEKDVYRRDKISGKFDETYITQLVQNYRSHKDILKIPNKLFYDGQLKAMASKDITHRFLYSNILPSNCPIVFKSVQGFYEREKNDKSLFNKKEIDAVISYVNKLLQDQITPVAQSDIGIVTPYKMQCKKIMQICRKNRWNDITIGTSEVFQGKEKSVMIVSTVRAGGKYLGFVNDPRRMNVVLTRAKSLLIIVGDPHTLKLDENWAALIKFCLKNKCLIQSSKKIYNVI